MKIVLFEPEIPPNTGNVARLCAAFGIELNLVEPLGFRLENRYLKRAGLDYWPHVQMSVWSCWDDFLKHHSAGRLIMATTKGHLRIDSFAFLPDDAIILGPETRGLPQQILAISPFHIRIPSINMEDGGVRSLNLSTAAGIFLYAAMCSSGLLAGLP